MKFKIGDRVKVVNTLGHGAKVGMTGEIVEVNGDIYGVRLDEWFGDGHDMYGKCEQGHGQWMTGENLELVCDNHKIVITSDGKTTLARLYEGKKVVKHAQANCSPNDEFNYIRGARIAFERLMEEKPEAKPKYYSGKVVCVESDCDWWTAGKVYEFVNGKVFDDECTERERILDVADMNDKMYGCARFIELKE